MSFWKRYAPQRSLMLAFLAGSVVVLVTVRQAFANGLPAGLGFFPGLAPIDFFSGPLLTVAVAIIERPFFARCGLTPWALIHSLRANFLSYLLGIVVSLVYIAAVRIAMLNVSLYAEMFFFLLPLLLVVMTIWFEERFAVRVLAPNRKVRTRWIVVGNIVSNLALLALGVLASFLLSFIGTNVHQFIYALEEYQTAFVMAYLAIFVGAVLLALGVPLWEVLPKSLQYRWGVPIAACEADSSEVSPPPAIPSFQKTVSH